MKIDLMRRIEFGSEPILSVVREEIARLGVEGTKEIVRHLAGVRVERAGAAHVRKAIEHVLYEEHGVVVDHPRRGT